MHTFAEKPKATQHPPSSNFSMRDQAYFGQSPEVRSFLHLQRTIGNQAVQRLLQADTDGPKMGSDILAKTRFAHEFSRFPVHSEAPLRPQAKLIVNAPGDIYEREADAMADQVMRGFNDQSSPLKNDQSSIYPLPESLAPIVQTQSESGATASNTLSNKITSSLGGGSEMDPSTQAFMQRSFGTSFSRIRIHMDSEAAQMSRELGAYAFTVGRDIYFDSGKYSPGTNAGKHLLAHELTHTIQQGHSRAVQKQTDSRRQAEAGLGILIEEERPEAAELPETIQMQIQRSTSWAGATVHETRNKAADSLSGDAPVTWQMLNGTMLKTEADADSSINLPTISTSGAGKKWKAQVDTVPAQEGADDETVLSPGPWSTVAKKADIGAKFGLAVCTGGGNSTFSAHGKPSDDAVYKANRRHEDHHVADDKVAFEETVVKWDKKLEEAKSKGAKFQGTDAAKAEASLWAAMGGEPKKVARKYRTLSFTKGGQYHATAAGGPMSISNAQANADCSTSSIDVTNPS